MRHVPFGFTEARGSGPGATLALSHAGLVMGHGSVLVRAAPDDTARLHLDADRDRCMALLSVVGRRPITTDDFHHIEAAAGSWSRGDPALANLRLVFAKLPRIEDGADADRLALAEYLLDSGMAPADLMKALGLDPADTSLGKYSPDQPRVPAGHGRESGRWSADGPVGARKTPNIPFE